MPTITLSDAYDAKLKTLAASDPFLPREVWIERLIDDAVSRKGLGPNCNGDDAANEKMVIRLSPDSGKLTHTKLLSADVDGLSLDRPKWNSLMFALHVMARKRLGSYEDVRKASEANLRPGRYEDDGYRYLAEADLSVQGVDANIACRHTFGLAEALNVPIKVTFEWRDKEGAAHPGMRGLIEWNPKDS